MKVIEYLVLGVSGLLWVFGVLGALTLAGLWPLPKPFYEGHIYYAVTSTMLLVMLAGALYTGPRIMRRLRARWPWLG